jgi:hypothetical protein
MHGGALSLETISVDRAWHIFRRPAKDLTFDGAGVKPGPLGI